MGRKEDTVFWLWGIRGYISEAALPRDTLQCAFVCERSDPVFIDYEEVLYYVRSHPECVGIRAYFLRGSNRAIYCILRWIHVKEDDEIGRLSFEWAKARICSHVIETGNWSGNDGRGSLYDPESQLGKHPGGCAELITTWEKKMAPWEVSEDTIEKTDRER